MARKTSTARQTSTARKRNTGGKPARERAAAGPCFVVGYDGSPEARHAAVWAARRAAPHGRLVLIHASRPRHRWLPVELLSTGAERHDRGRALVDELIMDGDEALLEVPLEVHVVDDAPARALVEAARRHEAAEIIVGSHHRSRADRLSGDVAAELVGSAPVPVCVVPLGGEPQVHEVAGDAQE